LVLPDVLSPVEVALALTLTPKSETPKPLTTANVVRQRPVTVWLTGISGAGKSTLAIALERRLIGNDLACHVLDGDNVRLGLNRDLGFSAADRSENIRRVAEVAKLMNDAGLIVITAFISPYRADREMARQIIGADNFFEVHMATPIATCEQRDVKGLYKKARSGEIADFTGVSAPYELPLNPVISINTSLVSVDDSLSQLYKILSSSLVKNK
jgi:adenylyl-sulfate kinase